MSSEYDLLFVARIDRFLAKIRPIPLIPFFILIRHAFDQNVLKSVASIDVFCIFLCILVTDKPLDDRFAVPKVHTRFVHHYRALVHSIVYS